MKWMKVVAFLSVIGMIQCLVAATLMKPGSATEDGSVFVTECVSYVSGSLVAEDTLDEDIQKIAENDLWIKRLQLKEKKEREQREAEARLEQLKKNEYYGKYLNIKQENKDVIGWIKISDMSISYPILFSGDDFYLDHNVKKEEDPNGAIYLDPRNKKGWGKVNLINGHNMKSGKMFGLVDYFKQEKYCRNHQDIIIAREGCLDTYRVFSVFLTDSEEEVLSFCDEKIGKLKDFIITLGNRSMHELEYESDAEDIIILNTCSYEYSNAHILVCAYKMSR